MSRRHLPGGVMTTTTPVSTDGANAAPVLPEAAANSAIDPVTLARLDYGLFLALRRMGTSKERICSALNLSYAEYDYIDELE